MTFKIGDSVVFAVDEITWKRWYANRYGRRGPYTITSVSSSDEWYRISGEKHGYHADFFVLWKPSVKQLCQRIAELV